MPIPEILEVQQAMATSHGFFSHADYFIYGCPRNSALSYRMPLYIDGSLIHDPAEENSLLGPSSERLRMAIDANVIPRPVDFLQHGIDSAWLDPLAVTIPTATLFHVYDHNRPPVIPELQTTHVFCDQCRRCAYICVSAVL